MHLRTRKGEVKDAGHDDVSENNISLDWKRSTDASEMHETELKQKKKIHTEHRGSERNQWSLDNEGSVLPCEQAGMEAKICGQNIRCTVETVRKIRRHPTSKLAR